MMRTIRTIITALSTLVLSVTCCSCYAVEPAPLVFAGPPEGILSLPVLRMLETSAGQNVKFVPWRTPDQLRAIVAGNTADVAACHLNVATNLANRGADIRMLNITLWKLLWITDSAKETTAGIEGLRGRKLGISLKSDLPDILFGIVLKKQGLGPDFCEIIYGTSSLNVAQQLLSGKVDAALLPEPIVSTALRRAAEQRLPLYRGADMQKMWQTAFDTTGTARLPLAGCVAIGRRVDDTTLRAFVAAYADAARWCCDNPHEAALLPARHFKETSINVEGLADSIRYCRPEPMPAKDAKPEIEAYLRAIITENANIIGGQLPEPNFYFE